MTKIGKYFSINFINFLSLEIQNVFLKFSANTTNRKRPHKEFHNQSGITINSDFCDKNRKDILKRAIKYDPIEFKYLSYAKSSLVP